MPHDASIASRSVPCPGGVLREIFFERTQRNASYSLRAFARDAGMSHSYLSLILNGKRPVPPRRALRIADRLKLDPATSSRFLDAVRSGLWDTNVRGKAAAAAPAEAFFSVDLDRFRVLSDWYHLALLDLTLLRDFRPSYAWIARALGITTSQARSAAKRLERLGLLRIEGDSWIKTHRMLSVPAGVPAQAVRKFHRQMIERSLRALRSSDVEDFEARLVTGAVMAIDGSRLPEAKRRIAKFRRSLLRFLTAGEATDLYQLNVQLFPIVKQGRRDLR